MNLALGLHHVKKNLVNLLKGQETKITGKVLRMGYGGKEEHSYSLLLENYKSIFVIKTTQYNTLHSVSLTSIGDEVEFIADQDNLVYSDTFKNHSLQKIIS